MLKVSKLAILIAKNSSMLNILTYNAAGTSGGTTVEHSKSNMHHGNIASIIFLLFMRFSHAYVCELAW